MARQEQAIGVVDNRVVQVQAGIVAMNDGVIQLQQGAVQDRQVNTARHEQVSNQFAELHQKVDTLVFDQQKFQQFITSLVTDSDVRSEQRHAEVKKEVQGVNAAVASFRNETGMAYNQDFRIII